jgi:hypothetical protein
MYLPGRVLPPPNEYLLMKSLVHAAGEVDPTAALERGDVLLVAEPLLEPRRQEHPLFSPTILAHGKNISFDPGARRIGGSRLTGSDAATLAGMMERYSRGADELVRRLFPGYAGHLYRARASFRPVEIAGRPSSWRKDDTRLHIDSFPASPVQGRRILRVFTNVNPDRRPRSWRLGEDFESLCRVFASALRPPPAAATVMLQLLRVTKTRRSPYDGLMLQLHDRMKQDVEYQARAPQTAVDFPAGATWIAFTDQVSHAAMAGQYQLEQTFLLPVDAMREPSRSPLRVLEAVKNRRLA